MRRMALVGCLALGLAAGSAAAKMAPIGVAKVDITPQTPVRMYGYASRKTESEGVAGRLKAAALAIGDNAGDGPAVLLTVDNGSVPAAIRAEVLARVQQKVPLKADRFMLCNSHNHSGPALKGMEALTGTEREHMEAYRRELTERLEQVVLKALADRRPGQLSLAIGSVGFAANRRVLKDGKWAGFGALPEAPVDHRLPLLRVTDAQGKVRAVVLNYACHNTTFRGNFKQIHGDWAGCAQEYIEADHPGVVALVTIGCGADADPSPHTTIEVCRRHGRSMADEVKRLLAGEFRSLSARLTTRFAALDVPCSDPPSAAELDITAKHSWALSNAAKRLHEGGTLPKSIDYSTAAWCFGDDLAMVFLAGEVVVDYALRLQREFDAARLWINAYSNDVSFYVASQRLEREGGYELNNSLATIVTYGHPERLQPALEDRIVERVHQLVPNTFRAKAAAAAPAVLVEAEGFADLGGWVVDQQVMDQMGSPYLLAHGLGVPVRDATTTAQFPQPGKYRLWVRTRDWVAPWKTPDTHPDMKAVGTPGIFQVLVGGQAAPVTFGTQGVAWHWQDGGVLEVQQKTVALALHDLTGFAGRCDALLFTAPAAPAPSNDLAALKALRRKLRGLPEVSPDAGEFDLVVVGGGAAGCCAAVSAARLGCRVALIHDRPVLGGNNSSEVRVGLSGLIHQEPYPRLGDPLDEWGPVGHWNLYQAKKAPDLPRSKEVLAIIERHPEKKTHNAGPASNYEDQHKLAVVQAEKNLTLCLSTRAGAVEMTGNRIAAVIAEDIRSGQRRKFRARLVADCTGDGVIGALAGADFAYGRESQAEFGEDTAPAVKDELVMGTSIQWYAEEEGQASAFPECPWALPLNEKTCVKSTRGDWDWETGATRNHVTEIERIRDYGLRVVFGNWTVLKNHPQFKQQFARQRLKWVAYIGGKRESRRLLGDVILRQQDIVEARPFPDASVTTTWTIDLHYPKDTLCACEAFRSVARHIKIKPYPIPYRCLYSRNVANLLMAGRNISVTHVALGTVRVMRTTGMMGEVVGMAAALCKQYNTTPRGVYEKRLEDLQKLMQRGVGRTATSGADTSK